jgi:hypothetical protein
MRRFIGRGLVASSPGVTSHRQLIVSTDTLAEAQARAARMVPIIVTHSGGIVHIDGVVGITTSGGPPPFITGVFLDIITQPGQSVGWCVLEFLP